MLLLSLMACAAEPLPSVAPTAQGETFAMEGITVFGVPGATDVVVEDGRFLSVGSPIPTDTLSLPGASRWLVPAFIDSHVHIAYYPVADELTQNGVAAVVDLAAPDAIFDTDHGRLKVVASGPMVTAIGGYPTQSWGSNGYGLECADADAAADAVTTLHGRGAGVIKLPVTGANQLNVAALTAATERAHALGIKTTSHATGDDSAAMAHAAGIDLLAHTPTNPLGEANLDAWGQKAVVSTLVAFGNGAATRENLQTLRERGATVLYGTDLGNTRVPGIDPSELQALLATGMSPSEVIASGTSVPAAYWGLDDLGQIAPGYAASFLILDEDPLLDPTAVTRPTDVYIDGVRVGP